LTCAICLVKAGGVSISTKVSHFRKPLSALWRVLGFCSLHEES
jgi:hypothetical protein